MISFYKKTNKKSRLLNSALNNSVLGTL